MLAQNVALVSRLHEWEFRLCFPTPSMVWVLQYLDEGCARAMVIMPAGTGLWLGMVREHMIVPTETGRRSCGIITSRCRVHMFPQVGYLFSRSSLAFFTDA